MTPQIGNQAPQFALPDENNTKHSLSDFKGQYVLIYFYPKDDTPGCTREACTMRDNMPNFEKLNAKIIGISADNLDRHRKFSEKYGLNFLLLSDEDKTVLNEYGVWAKKKFMGREYMGILRQSLLVDPNGKIVKIYEQVKPDTHAEEVIADLKQLTTKN